jgi:pimeloyl-ACP methyl ester carboxylesterase
MIFRMTETVVVGGRNVAYEVWGPADGRPWVFIGGTPNSRYLLLDDAFFERAGIRAVTFDRPGFGASDRLPGRRVVDVVGDVQAIAAAMGWDRYGVFGGSGGTPHALACGALLADQVTRVVVCGQVAPSSMPGFTDSMLPFNRQMMELADADPAAYTQRLADTSAAILADPMGAFLATLDGIPDVDRELMSRPEIQERAVRMLVEAFRNGSDGWHDDAMAIRGDWGFTLDNVRVPVRMYHGGLDVNCPLGHAQYVASLLPDAELTIWPELGHMSATKRLADVDAFA